MNTVILQYTGMLVGSLHLTELAQKLPQELVISDDQIRLLESIGQGEPCLMYLQQQTVHCEMKFWNDYVLSFCRFDLSSCWAGMVELTTEWTMEYLMHSSQRSLKLSCMQILSDLMHKTLRLLWLRINSCLYATFKSGTA